MRIEHNLQIIFEVQIFRTKQMITLTMILNFSENFYNTTYDEQCILKQTIILKNNNDKKLMFTIITLKTLVNT